MTSSPFTFRVSNVSALGKLKCDEARDASV
jgi:hypothetical protein